MVDDQVPASAMTPMLRLATSAVLSPRTGDRAVDAALYSAAIAAARIAITARTAATRTRSPGQFLRGRCRSASSARSSTRSAWCRRARRGALFCMATGGAGARVSEGAAPRGRAARVAGGGACVPFGLEAAPELLPERGGGGCWFEASGPPRARGLLARGGAGEVEVDAVGHGGLVDQLPARLGGGPALVGAGPGRRAPARRCRRAPRCRRCAEHRGPRRPGRRPLRRPRPRRGRTPSADGSAGSGASSPPVSATSAARASSRTTSTRSATPVITRWPTPRAAATASTGSSARSTRAQTARSSGRSPARVRASVVGPSRLGRGRARASAGSGRLAPLPATISCPQVIHTWLSRSTTASSGPFRRAGRPARRPTGGCSSTLSPPSTRCASRRQVGPTRSISAAQARLLPAGGGEHAVGGGVGALASGRRPRRGLGARGVPGRRGRCGVGGGHRRRGARWGVRVGTSTGPGTDPPPGRWPIGVSLGKTP